MPKKVLQIDDFTGGLNCYSDPRDIEPNEFAQNWNVNVSQSGITKLGGSLFESIRNLPHDNTNQQFAFGLFATGVDYSLSIIDGEFENGFEEGAIAGYASATPSITLAAASTHQAYGDHGTDDFYNNYAITIYKTADGAAPQGETRRITDYVGSSKVATLDSAFSADPLTNGTEYYRIYRWVGSNTTNETFGNDASKDYVDKGGSDFPYDDIESYSTNNPTAYFLRTKVSSVTDHQSKNLGWITYNPSTSSTDLTEDSTTIGATTLKSGVEYLLSFYCKATSRYYGYVSDTAHGERVPFVQLYSDSVTDGTNTGLYLSQSNIGPTFLSGADSTYNFADDIAKQYVDNGDFEDGSATGGDGGRAGDGSNDPPTGWMAYDGNIDHANNVITYSYNTDSDSFGGEGNTLVMTPGSAFDFGYATGETVKPNCYMYQDLTLEDNQWYELFFAYSSASDGVCFSVVDTFDLTSTGILAAEDEAANDSEATLTVDTTSATDALVKNKEIYTNTGGTVKFFGVCDTVDSTTQITFAGGLTEAVSDNDVLSTANYITPWTFLPDSGGITSYLYVGQNKSSDYIKPHKFFVPDNSGTPRVIRIAFSATKASTAVRFDGISVKKSFPDLLSMSSKCNISDPYGDEMVQWNRYQCKFKIPSSYDNATDWVLRLHAGTWGYQNGATSSVAAHTVYFDSIRLEANEPDNLIFLNDNTSTNSKVMIYSDNSKNWTENELVWSGIKMRPVYDYINGMLKISDANFESGNSGKIFHYLKTRKLNGGREIEGYRVRNSPLSSAPILKVTANSDSVELDNAFMAVNYMNSYTFVSEHQTYGASGTTNWPRDNINGSIGTILHYYHSDNHWSAENLYDESGTELTDASSTLLSDTHPIYFAWAGQDGTDNDMGGQISGAGDVRRVEFQFDYSFQSAYRDGSNNSLTTSHPPIFIITIGKMSNDIFTSGAPSDANQKLLIRGNPSVVTMAGDTIGVATFKDENGNDIDLSYDVDNDIPWQYSQLWDWDTITSNNYGGSQGNRLRKGTNTYRGVVSFDEGVIAVTDDMIMRVAIQYPSRNNVTLKECIEFNATSTDNDWDFARYEKIRFEYINVFFDAAAWSSAADGMISSDRDKTKVDLKFETPSGATAVGWEGRTFLLGCSSVNVFGEESNINQNDFIIGGTAAGSSSTGVSLITSGQSPTVNVYVGDEVALDDYRTEIKYYMKDTESDIWYLQFYVDLINNKIHSTTSNYYSYGTRDKTNRCYEYNIPNSKILNYNEIDSYESQTLVPQGLSLAEMTCEYKASVVANNKLYVGNIKQNGEIYPDRMISSLINKYNILPSSNFIDVAINDGDEITALEYYKDKLLQFKKSKVFIINISGDYEFLEETFDHVGVLGSHQVTKTPYGVVWINSKGCFLYDGETLTNLIDNKIAQNSDSAQIAKNFWTISNHETETNNLYNSGTVAYNASTKDIVIQIYLSGASPTGYSSNNTTGIQSTAQPDGYVYNIPTESWYFAHKGFTPRFGAHNSGISSNFTTNADGDIIVYKKETSTGDYGHLVNDILKWNSNKGNDEAILTQRAASSVTNRRASYFTTSDFTFGDISVRKKIYKVYITYKSMDSSGSSANSMILVKHAINGSQSYTAFDDSSSNYAAATGLTGSTAWQVAELVPSSSINNIYSFQLRFEGNALTSPPNFQINDISIIYRTKPVK